MKKGRMALPKPTPLEKPPLPDIPPVLTLQQAAEFVVRLKALGAGDKRAQIDAVRHRILRDVNVGKLRQQRDQTFRLAEIGTWLRRTWWRGQGRPGKYEDLPGEKLDSIERLLDSKGRAVGLAIHVSTRHVPRLPSTVEGCHAEIVRLNAMLDEYFRQRSLLLDLKRKEEKRKARRESALRAIARRHGNR